jgi:hypothetical protein
MAYMSDISSNWPGRDTNGKSITAQAVVFGLGSMFNHSIYQNIGWDRDLSKLLVTYKALRDIEAGEELCKTTVYVFTNADLARHIIRIQADLQGHRCSGPTRRRIPKIGQHRDRFGIMHEI